MNTLQQYTKVMNDLAVAFENHIDPECAEQFLGHFPWDDYGIYCDSSEFYAWSPHEMYLILKEDIPYDIACEHQDLTINDSWGELPHYNLKTYWQYRKVNMDISLEDFLRWLKRKYHLKQADVNTEEFQEENDKFIKEITEAFLKNIKS